MLAMFKIHTATVETYTGPTTTGDGYAPPVQVEGFYDEGLTLGASSGGLPLQRSQYFGEQYAQKSRFYADVADADKFALESRVTVAGHVAQVESVHINVGPPAWGPVEHVEVVLK